MHASPEAIDEFWSWFRTHRFEFETIEDRNDPFWDIVIGELHALDERLWFEMSRPDSGDRELIITAEGHEKVFPLVDTIVDRAPKVSGWRFIALKPPMGFEFETEYEGINFNPGAMWFVPLENPSHPDAVGLRIGIPNYSPAIKRQAENAILVILDTALGERAAANDIQYLEVGPLPDSPEDGDYVELSALPEYLEWRKQR